MYVSVEMQRAHVAGVESGRLDEVLLIQIVVADDDLQVRDVAQRRPDHALRADLRGVLPEERDLPHADLGMATQVQSMTGQDTLDVRRAWGR